MIQSILQRIRHARGRLLGMPAFRYEEDQTFLRRFTRAEWPGYEAWLERHRRFTRPGLEALWNQASRFTRKPLISVLMPVYNPDPAELWQAVESLLWQAYPHWELCIADDRSTNREYLRVLGRLRDRRVKIRLNPAHAGIAGTSQAALDQANGDYVALMDQDDELYPDALFAFVQALQEQEIDYFYSDRDMISPGGRRYMHFLKPGWSPEYLLSFNYGCHLEIYRKGLVEAVGGFRPGYEGSQDYDLLLRATDQPCRVYHHPMVLYSWRQSRGSVATDLDAKGYAFEAGVRAVRDAVRRRRLPVREVIENPTLWRGHYRLLWDESRLSAQPVTLVALSNQDDEASRITALLRDCAASFPHADFRVAPPSAAAILALLETLPAACAVFFCDGSVRTILAPALADMLGFLAIPGVEVVGGKCVDPDNRVRDTGLAIDDSGQIMAVYGGKAGDDPGYGAVGAVPRNVAAVFPAFWGTRVEGLRKRWTTEGQGGYYYSALRYCMDTGKGGGRIVCIPSMCLCLEPGRPDCAEDLRLFGKEWQAQARHDSYYNPNLPETLEDFCRPL
ncbi:MAG: glycosyltransferase family 2 protein [Thermodesulfobacteriota bacterium]